MQVEREIPDMEAISEVFRELGLEKPDVQDHFRQLAEPSDWYTWRKRRYEPQGERIWLAFPLTPTLSHQGRGSKTLCRGRLAVPRSPSPCAGEG